MIELIKSPLTPLFQRGEKERGNYPLDYRKTVNMLTSIINMSL